MDKDQIAHWMQAILEPGQVVEVRSIPLHGKAVVSRLFATAAPGELDKLATYAAMESGHRKGVYFTPNPLSSAHGSGYNGAAKDEDIAKRIWLLIDADPIRPDKKESSTESEHEIAIRVVQSIRATLSNWNIRGIVTGDSGNGAHLMIPVEMPNDPKSKETIAAFLKELQMRFGTPQVEIDPSVFNAARIWKLPGTEAKKGDATAERPHRFARLIEVEDNARRFAEPNTAIFHRLMECWNPRFVGKGSAIHADIVRRAIAYLEKEPPAIAGQHGHDRAFHVAGVCYDGFMLDEEDCLIAMSAWNARCQPPWDEKDLRRKINEIKKKAGPRGKLAEQSATLSPSNTATPIAGRVTLRASHIPPRKVEWLWPGRIPLGKMTTFAGSPGLGKTFTLCDIAARVSRGSEWPFSNGECAKPGQVLFITGEDDYDDTIVPRMIEAGGDLDMVSFLNYETLAKFTLGQLDVLDKAVAEIGGLRFIAIDPPTAFLGQCSDNNNGEIRGLLGPLGMWASKHHVAMVLVTHLNKGGAQLDAQARVMGSVAWVAAVRSAHLFVKDQDDDTKRIFACIKTNVGPEPKALSYRLAVTGDMARIEWLSVIETTADEAIGKPSSRPRKIVAAEWLVERFKERLEWPSNDLFQAGKEHGISRNAIFEAKQHPLLEGMKVKQITAVSGDRSWVWWVPSDWPALEIDDNTEKF